MPIQPNILGIPNKADYGDLSKLKAKQIVDYVLHKHQADKARLHYDLRLGTPDTGLYSWAARKGMPEPGKKHLAVQQPVHAHSYKDFKGEITEGYGKGTVEHEDIGKALITDVRPDKIHFTLAHTRYPERFALIKPKSFGKDKDWLLINTTPIAPVTYEKLRYKKVPHEQVEDVLKQLEPGASVQAKIDGSASLTKLLKDKIEVLSYRTSKVTNRPIIHDERVFHTLPKIDVPKEYAGSVLKGELYGTTQGKHIPVQALGGLLNSGIAKSIEDQKARNVKMQNLVYDIQQLGKKHIDLNKTPYNERLEMVKKVLGSIGGEDKGLVKSIYHLPEEAKTTEEALKLWKTIRTGKHPLTNEGIILHPASGTPIKAKLTEDYDVYPREFFPGKGKYKDVGVGGFRYSFTPKGKVLGEVGTGLSDQLRKDMFLNPQEYLNRVAKVRSQQQLPSGALRVPSLLSFHEDYPTAKMK